MSPVVRSLTPVGGLIDQAPSPLKSYLGQAHLQTTELYVEQTRERLEIIALRVGDLV